MNQYHSVEEYINEVQKHIRWKRARNIATLDLKQHIQDQFDVYTSKGVYFVQIRPLARENKASVTE